MAMITHIAPERLKKLANGRLNERESKPVLHHLAICDFCLGVIDVFWSGPPENPDAALPQDAAYRLKINVLRQIQQLRAGGL
jgi:hypothetical protein